MNHYTILITGCSTGIGYQAALTLKSRGHHVIASCRSEKDMQTLKSAGLDVVQMDLNHHEEIQNSFSKVLDISQGKLDVLINNAGFAQAGALEDLSRDDLRRQFETNVFGLMDLTRLCIPVMRKQGQGKIINVSSVLGIISMPFRGAYNASKYAVEGLSDTLRLELKHSGIQVITVEPGPVESQFRKTSVEKAKHAIQKEHSVYKDQYDYMMTSFEKQKSTSVFTKPPSTVVKAFIHAIEAKNPKIKYKVTLPTHLFAFLKRILPTRLLDAFLLYISKKELKPKPLKK